MSRSTLKTIFIVTGVIFFLGIFAAQPVAAIVLAIIVGGVFYTFKDRFRSETEAEAEMAAYRLEPAYHGETVLDKTKGAKVSNQQVD